MHRSETASKARLERWTGRRIRVMERFLMGASSVYLLVAAIGRFVEAMGAVQCPCTADCWCKRPGVSTFRWAAPIGHRLMAQTVTDGTLPSAG